MGGRGEGGGGRVVSVKQYTAYCIKRLLNTMAVLFRSSS